MKRNPEIMELAIIGRTPRGVRGLKLDHRKERLPRTVSHPARGAWIETVRRGNHLPPPYVAPREGCVD